LIIFGRFVVKFSAPRWALQEVALMAFAQTVDIESLQQARPTEAFVFGLFFFAAVLVTLANLFLAMVTSASGDAQATPEAVELAEQLLSYYGKRVMYGNFITAYVGFSKSIVEGGARLRFAPAWLSASRSKDAAILSHDGRLLFPSECLLTTLAPVQVNAVLRKFHHERINNTAHSAMIPTVLQRYLDFRDQNPYKNRLDQEHMAWHEQAAAETFKTHAVMDTEGMELLELSDRRPSALPPPLPAETESAHADSERSDGAAGPVETNPMATVRDFGRPPQVVVVSSADE